MASPDDLAELAMLRKIVESHEDCIKVLDLRGNVVSLNHGGVVALEFSSSDEIVGQYWPSLWQGPGLVAASAAIERAANGERDRFAGPSVTAKGNVKYWDVQVSPMVHDDGSPASILVVSRDVTAQHTAFVQIAELYALNSAVLASSTDYAIIALDLDGLVTLWNAGAHNIMQWSQAEMIGRPAHVFFTEEEVARGVPKAEMAKALEVGRAEDERWHRRKDGAQFWATGLMMPLRIRDGRHIGFIKILRDRTEARHAEEHRQLMVDELNHRVKNTLAIVQGIVSQSLRSASSPDEARHAVMERLTILSRAQDTLTQTSWDGAPLRKVVETAVAPLLPGKGRIEIFGPDLDLGARSVLALTMALHELGTNATKYGALSTDEGIVTITWSVDDGVFRLTWCEAGGPLVVTPTRKGFGSRLIESGLSRGLGGKASLEFNPQGVAWTVQAPFIALTQT